MKLIINISKEEYRKVQNGRASVSMMRNAIRNGIPLDVIKAEIVLQTIESTQRKESEG